MYSSPQGKMLNQEHPPGRMTSPSSRGGQYSEGVYWEEPESGHVIPREWAWMGKRRGPRAGGLSASRGQESEKDPERETQKGHE